MQSIDTCSANLLYCSLLHDRCADLFNPDQMFDHFQLIVMTRTQWKLAMILPPTLFYSLHYHQHHHRWYTIFSQRSSWYSSSEMQSVPLYPRIQVDYIKALKYVTNRAGGCIIILVLIIIIGPIYPIQVFIIKIIIISLAADHITV